MNKTNGRISVTLVLLLLILVAVPIPSAADGTTDAATLLSLTTAGITAGISDTSGFSVTNISVDGNYAITAWVWSNAGGEVVWSRPNATSAWHSIAHGGGSVNSTSLVSYGVPLATASSLIAGLQNCPTELRHPLSSIIRKGPHPMTTSIPGSYVCLLGVSAPTPTPSPTPHPSPTTRCIKNCPQGPTAAPQSTHL